MYVRLSCGVISSYWILAITYCVFNSHRGTLTFFSSTEVRLIFWSYLCVLLTLQCENVTSSEGGQAVQHVKKLVREFVYFTCSACHGGTVLCARGGIVWRYLTDKNIVIALHNKLRNQ